MYIDQCTSLASDTGGINGTNPEPCQTQNAMALSAQSCLSAEELKLSKQESIRGLIDAPAFGILTVAAELICLFSSVAKPSACGRFGSQEGAQMLPCTADHMRSGPIRRESATLHSVKRHLAIVAT